MMLPNILTKGEEELLTRNLSRQAKEPVIRWAKQARLSNHLLKLAINQDIEITYKENPGIFFEGKSEETRYVIELLSSIG